MSSSADHAMDDNAEDEDLQASVSAVIPGEFLDPSEDLSLSYRLIQRWWRRHKRAEDAEAGSESEYEAEAPDSRNASGREQPEDDDAVDVEPKCCEVNIDVDSPTAPCSSPRYKRSRKEISASPVRIGAANTKDALKPKALVANKRKCVHGRQPSKCTKCYGPLVRACAHGRKRVYCTECDGRAICMNCGRPKKRQRDRRLAFQNIVSFACGHSYCKTCVSAYWYQNPDDGVCPHEGCYGYNLVPKITSKTAKVYNV